MLCALAAATLVHAGAHAAENPVPVASARETVPGSHAGDSMDDPAIWVHPTDPSRSLVLANDKLGSLDVYDLDGSLVQRLSDATPFWGNVDVKQGVRIGGVLRDIVAVNHGGGIRVYEVDPDTRRLSSITDGQWGGSAEGLCLYRSNVDDTVYAINITLPGRLRQWELGDSDGDGLVEGTLRRDFQVGSEAEGCVTHDETGELYVSEEDVALWRYEAEPDGGALRSVVDRVLPDGRNAADLEGLAIADAGSQGAFLIASAQNVADPGQNYLTSYAATGDNAFVRSFRVVDGTTSDDCDRTDGIAAYAGDLGPDFPQGLFVCQDDANAAPGQVGNQDLKLVRLEDAVPLTAGRNRAPVARMSASCDGVTCTYSASGSSDSDGTVASWSWDFGDGATGSGTTVVHTYAGQGSHAVTLRVSDDDAATDRQVRLVGTGPVVADEVSFVGSSRSTPLNATRTFTATVPIEVVAGDALLAVWSGSGDGDLPAPAGWSRVGRTTGGTNATTVWQRVADGTEAGAPVSVDTPTYMRGVLGVLAYRGTDLTDPVMAVQGAGVSARTSRLQTPTVISGREGGWRVSAWSAKTSADLTITGPAGEVERVRHVGSGTGNVSLLVSDSAGPVATGAQGGLTADLAPATNKATAWTILLRPAVGAPPSPNQPPSASFTHSCQSLACSFDATGSGDPDGTVVDYAWVFEDTDRGVGATPSHVFSAPGSYPVTLTVTDDDGAQTSSTVNLTVSEQTTSLEFIGADHSTATKSTRSWSAEVPSGVRAGDGLVLVHAGSSTTGLTGPGAGWSLLDSRTAGSATTTVWRRSASAADAGTTVSVQSPTYMHAVVALMAYRGSAPDPVGGFASRAVTSAASAWTTPVVQSPTPGSWRLSLWSAKAATSAPWGAPAGETERVSFVGSGRGQVSLLATDSGADVPAGAQGGLRASGVSSNKVTTWTLLLRP